MKRQTSRWISLTAMAGLFASPLLAAGAGDPNGPRIYDSDSSLPLVVQGQAQLQPKQQLQQAPVPVPAAPALGQEDRFSAEELKEMVAAIALYPDPLLAQILAGATYPLDIVQASRFIKANANDPALPQRIADQRWDPSVQALAHYPSVLQMMDENLDWTQNLGAAFIYQQEDLMAAIQTCRLQAQAAGNLATTPQQTVVVEEKTVYIYPADPQVIYVPVYEPEIVYVQRRPDYFGHAISFGIGFSVGSWLDLDCDWRHRHVYRGGWYNRHHGHHDHHDRRDVNVRIYKDTYGTRIDPDHRQHDDHRRDDRHDRDRDDRDRDDRDRRENIWRRDASKPAPQVRSSPQHGSRVVTPVRPNIDSRADRNDRDGDDRAERGASDLRDGRFAGRGDDRSDQARDARAGDRSDERTPDRRTAEHRPDERGNDRADWGNRSRSGYVRPTTGYTRPVTPTIPTPPRAADEHRERSASSARPSPSPWNRPTTADRGERSGDDRRDSDRGRDDRGGDARPDDSRRVEATPAADQARPATGPTWNRGDSRRPDHSANERPQITPRVTRPADSSASPAPRTASEPTPRAMPEPTPSRPVVPTVRPAPHAPAPSPRMEVPAPTPRVERSTPAPSVERSGPPAHGERSAPSPRQRVEDRPTPRPTPSAPSRASAPSKPSPAASKSPAPAPAKPAPEASRSSSRPSIASERAAQNAAARERSSSAREGRRGK